MISVRLPRSDSNLELNNMQNSQIKQIAESIARQLLSARGSATENSRGILVRTRKGEAFFPKSIARGVGSISRGI